eukprot:TRINITY_DN3905_c0_g2_i1.p1 TRINITY_DN3905_c0_g2~~TRINITY_DN3905_c0_g2_i1.p1  ORF type:complete len:690 (+),score=129.37 TRINITY_DN3905_c0_g2_i1:247-2070(+)
MRAVLLASKDVLQAVQSQEQSKQFHDALVSEVEKMDSDQPLSAEGLLTEQQADTLRRIFKDLNHLGQGSKKNSVLKVCAGMESLTELFMSLKASLQAELDSCGALSNELARKMQMARIRMTRMERDLTGLCGEFQTTWSSRAQSATHTTASPAQEDESKEDRFKDKLPSIEACRGVHHGSQRGVCIFNSDASCSNEPESLRTTDHTPASSFEHGTSPAIPGAKSAGAKATVQRSIGKLRGVSQGVAGFLWLFGQVASRTPRGTPKSQQDCKVLLPSLKDNLHAISSLPTSTELPVSLPVLLTSADRTISKDEICLHEPNAPGSARLGEHKLPEVSQGSSCTQKSGAAPSVADLPTAYSLGYPTLEPASVQGPFGMDVELRSDSRSSEFSYKPHLRSDKAAKETAEADTLRSQVSSDAVAEKCNFTTSGPICEQSEAFLRKPGYGQHDPPIAALGSDTLLRSEIETHAAASEWGGPPHALDGEIDDSSHHFRRASRQLKRRLQPLHELPSCAEEVPKAAVNGKLQFCRHRWHILRSQPADMPEAVLGEAISPDRRRAKQAEAVHFSCQENSLTDDSEAHSPTRARPPRKMSRQELQRVEMAQRLIAGG